jgi:hypothetical protein
VWLGRQPLTDALRSGEIAFEGPRALTRRMPDVLRLSVWADAVSASRDED